MNTIRLGKAIKRTGRLKVDSPSGEDWLVYIIGTDYE
jgi:hypothetical protein